MKNFTTGLAAAAVAFTMVFSGTALAELSDEGINLCQTGTGADINAAIKAKKLNINDKDAAGYTPLMYAATYNSNESAVTALLKAKAQPNATGPNGITALMCATYNPNVKVTAALLHAQAKTNVKDKSGMTPLMYACQNSQSTELVEMLLKNKAPYDVKDINGFTPLIYAVYNSNPEIARALLKKGAKDNRVDKNGQNAFFHAAANCSDVNLVYEILSSGNGIDLSLVDKKGRNPALAAAATNPSLDVLTYLTNSLGYDLYAVDKEGNTALHLAAAYQTNPEIFVTLYELGDENGHYFKENAKNKAGKTPMDLLKTNETLANDESIQQSQINRGRQGLQDLVDTVNIFRGLFGK